MTGETAGFFDNLNIWMLMSVPASLIAIVLHEVCHGIAAYALGDPTAKASRRISFNPIRHIDPVGLLLLIYAGFGWAKPVPVNPAHFKHPKRDMAIVALAGPVSNFALSLLCVGGIRLTLLFEGSAAEWCFAFLTYTAIRSAGLGVFNLIPIPPLDGSKVLAAFLPNKAYGIVLRYERYGMFLLLGLTFLPRLLAGAGVYIQNPVIYPIEGAVNLLLMSGGLYEPLAQLLAYIRAETNDLTYRILDVVLGLEPRDVFEYLRFMVTNGGGG